MGYRDNGRRLRVGPWWKHTQAAILIAAFCVFSANPFALAQGPPVKPPISPPLNTVTVEYDVQRSIVLMVLDASKSPLDRQAVVKLYDPRRKVTVWRATTDQSIASFYDLSGGVYEIEVSAVGYKTQQTEVQIAYAQQGRRVEVLLERDPSAVDLNVSDDIVPAKHRKDAKRAIDALKSGNLAEAHKQLDKLYRFAPASPELIFLYGYLYLGLNDLDKAESYLSQAAALDPRRIRTLELLGRVQLQLQHNRDAQATLEQAVSANPGDWMAHSLLANAYLNLKQYEKAREHAQLALDEGKVAASASQLVLGEALAMLGKNKESIDALLAFLRDNPNDPAKANVDNLIAHIKANSEGTLAPAVPHTATAAVLSALPSLPDTPWGPPGVDETKPPVALNTPCPLAQVLEMSGRRVEELVENVSHFSATEYLVHEQLDRYGNPTSKENRTFDYIATIAMNNAGYFTVDENRQLRSGDLNDPDGINSKGFMSLALIFHPGVRQDFQISCEGLGHWQGQPTWLMYFRQRDLGSDHFGPKYIVGTRLYPVGLKGRAWIRASDFEIARIEAELLGAVDTLSVQHQIVEYGPIHFQRRNLDLWLPKSVDLYLEIKRHRYRRQLNFDRYMLFTVDSQQNLPALKAGPNGTLIPDAGCSDQSPTTCRTNSR